MNERIAMLEAILFMSSEPLGLEEIAELMGIGSKGYVSELIEEFRKDLQNERRGLELIERNGKFELSVKKNFLQKVSELSPHKDIPKGTLRTLALIAYNSPVEQSKIVKIRGNKAYNQIAELKKRGLVEAEKKGRKNILRITNEFLSYFGVESLEEFKNIFYKEKGPNPNI
jgi:segregation and condensation protein B